MTLPGWISRTRSSTVFLKPPFNPYWAGLQKCLDLIDTPWIVLYKTERVHNGVNAQTTKSSISFKDLGAFFVYGETNWRFA